ncbi:MAG: hypothetical protein OES09_00960 [Gammaproteobacteria bacterium]|nr:hypothetical protein [Gammaproteobacteria bacterium]
MDFSSTVTVLLSWAAYLSSYPAPERPPYIEFAPQSFFIEHACGGRDCDAVGWYNDKGVIYLDERLRYLDNVFVRSVMVHEFVHYLQDLSGKFRNSCAEQITREREAYAIQRSYVAEAHGEFAFIRVTHRGCFSPAG